MNAKELIERIEKTNQRSAWDKGVASYAVELAETLQEVYGDAELPVDFAELQGAMLNGAESWRAYSYGGCSFIYDADIAERLLPPSELKRKRGGELQPNSNETWLDVQARALRRASWLIGWFIPMYDGRGKRG